MTGMSVIDQICEVLSKLPMDDAGRKQADELIAAAQSERAEIVDALGRMHEAACHLANTGSRNLLLFDLPSVEAILKRHELTPLP
jgi:hypothetical protein